MLQIRRLLQLLLKGTSKRKIAQFLGAGRHTVDHYVARIHSSGMDIDSLLSLSDTALAALVYPSKPESKADSRLEYLLENCKDYQKELRQVGVTKYLLWQEYRRQVPDGYAYSQFCEHLKNHQRKNGATMHFTHRPGEFLQIDFAGKKLSYADTNTGEVIACPVLVCVLPYSGYTYVEVLPSAGQQHFFTSLSRCLRFLGGVPESALSDNMKQYVYKSNRYEPVFSEVSQQWALYYDTNLVATRVAKPKDKPSVEKAVHIAYMRIYALLRKETFYSIEELNRRVLACCQAHNHTLLQKRTYSRHDRFVADEQALLGPLPAEPFVLRHTAQAKVQKNYHVILGEDWHQYSVPYQYIGQTATLVYDSCEVEIYLGLQRIAAHRRNCRQHDYTTLREHMPEGHQRYQDTKGWDAAYFLGKAKELGESSTRVFERVLGSRTFTEQTYRSCQGLLRLAGRYGQERFEKACKRALPAPRVSYRLIDTILANNQDKQELSGLPGSLPGHDNIRGPQSYS
ncbi:IS21 family transposase [Pontibacter qinzhouensis]|nr:IS21 family transposase [Pontibacter qinzhouensis]